jgi:hypothetical protein
VIRNKDLLDVLRPLLVHGPSVVAASGFLRLLAGDLDDELSAAARAGLYDDKARLRAVRLHGQRELAGRLLDGLADLTGPKGGV